MKKALITLILVVVAIGIGLGVGFTIKNFNKGGETKPKAEEQPTKKLAEGGFIWGAQGGAYGLNRLRDPYRPENAKKQIETAEDLKINLIRANIELAVIQKPFSITYDEVANDDFIKKLYDKGFEMLLVLDPDVPKTIGYANYEEEGYKLGSYVSKRYGDKINYYQIANEVSGTVVKKDGDKGPFFKDDLGMEYDSNKYKVTLGWIKGMSRGIRENDSSAKILLSGHWILYGVFNNLVRDGADFDIIGWAYYSSDGDDPTKREYNYGNYMNLAEKLSQFKRDLWIVEANRAGGSYDKNAKTSSPSAEEEQANYLESLLKNVYNSGYFKGFIVFTLFDSPTAEELGYPQDAYLGLAEVKKTGSDNRIQKYKRAFYVFRDFITSHPKIPTI